MALDTAKPGEDGQGDNDEQKKHNAHDYGDRREELIVVETRRARGQISISDCIFHRQANLRSAVVTMSASPLAHANSCLRLTLTLEVRS